MLLQQRVFSAIAAGMHPRSPNAGHRPVQRPALPPRTTGPLPCFPIHRRESPIRHSAGTGLLFRAVSQVVDRKTPRWHCVLGQRPWRQDLVSARHEQIAWPTAHRRRREQDGVRFPHIRSSTADQPVTEPQPANPGPHCPVSIPCIPRLHTPHNRCEYFLIHQDDVIAGHQTDHVIADKHGGPTTLSNLALAFILCNIRKGSDLSSVDPETNDVTPLFNPRTQHWEDHFRFEDTSIIGQTRV